MSKNNNKRAAFVIDQFEKVGQMPVAWQSAARDLICAANVLYQRFEDVQPLKLQQETGKPINPDVFHTSLIPILMLYGLAIENLIKGLLVAKGTPATSKGKLNERLKTHDLKRLFEWASISTLPDDDHLLERLQRVIESGKYPIATKARISANINDAIFVLPTDIQHIGSLLEMLEDELRVVQPDRALDSIDLMALCKRTDSEEPQDSRNS